LDKKSYLKLSSLFFLFFLLSMIPFSLVSLITPKSLLLQSFTFSYFFLPVCHDPAIYFLINVFPFFSLFLSLSHLSASLSTHIFSIREKCEGFFFNVCVCTCVYVWCAKGSFFNVQITILELFWCQFHQHFLCTFFVQKCFA